MVLAAAGAFALHDKASSIEAASIALVLRGVALVFDLTFDGGITLPAFAFDEEKLVLRAEADQLTLLLANTEEFFFACEVFDVSHFCFSNRVRD